MMRKTEVLTQGRWSAIPFEELQEGDIFRLIDDNVPFIDTCGSSQWTVKTLPKKNSNGVFYVEVEEGKLGLCP